jgi:AcrR family transcriptional regulator
VAQLETAGRPGRPRRFDEAQERSLILDAAFEAIRVNGYAAVTVADILGEAGMSTRSFYRHFASKDELLHALFRRDAEQFAAGVTQRVEAAPDPRTALTTWIDEILGFAYDRGRAKRAAVLGSSASRGSLDAEELRRALELLIVSLTTVLVTGAADGTFTTAAPVDDARHISALAWETSGRMGEAATKAQKAELRAGLLAFVGRALGIAGR